jgi:FkbM family methyltransferase
MKKFGTDYGGFYYPSNLECLNKDSIIYCVGVGEDISHDIMLSHKLDSQIFLFDPTPRAIEHVSYIKGLFENKAKLVNNKRYGGGDPGYLNLLMKHKINSDNIHMFNFGLYTEDTSLKFYKPSNVEYVSHSVVHGMKSNNYINVEVKKLKTIMNELNHTNIDLLKIDIEGCECEVLEQMIKEKIFPKYLSVDFDLGWTGERIRDRKKCIATINLLKENGYKLLHENGPDYSFQKI